MMSTGSSRSSTRVSASWCDGVTFAAGNTSRERGHDVLPAAAASLVSRDSETDRRTASRFPSHSPHAAMRYAAFNACRATASKYRAPIDRISSLKS